MILRRAGLVAAVCSLALLTACASGPEATVKGFYKALDAGKTDKAKGYLSSQITEMLGDGKLDMALADMGKFQRQEFARFQRVAKATNYQPK